MLIVSSTLAFFFFWGALSGIDALLDQIQIPRGGKLHDAMEFLMYGSGAMIVASVMLEWLL